MDIKNNSRFINVAVGCLINKKQEILIAKRAQDKLFSEKWEFPGGKLEQGETYKEALFRELQEELDIDLKISTFLLAKTIDYKVINCKLKFFLCRNWLGEIKPVEGQQLSWQKIIDLDKVVMLDGNKEVIKVLQNLALLNKI